MINRYTAERDAAWSTFAAFQANCRESLARTLAPYVANYTAACEAKRRAEANKKGVDEAEQERLRTIMAYVRARDPAQTAYDAVVMPAIEARDRACTDARIRAGLQRGT